VLVGYRGTGKSTLGRILARDLNRRFLDADLEIEARAGCSIARIFAEQGEPAFRDQEEQVLRELAAGNPGTILATGGGAVVREANRRNLVDHGYIVWLKAEPAELARRLEADQNAGSIRPALTAAGSIAEIAAVLAARTPLYAAVADLAIETGGRSPDEIAAQIRTAWPG
jgi:shikimate kinase